MTPEKFTALKNRILASGSSRNLAQASFAEFLSELANEAAQQSDKNMAIQNKLVRQTWVVLAVAIIALGLQVVQIFRVVPQTKDRERYDAHAENQKADLSSPSPIKTP